MMLTTKKLISTKALLDTMPSYTDKLKISNDEILNIFKRYVANENIYSPVLVPFGLQFIIDHSMPEDTMYELDKTNKIVGKRKFHRQSGRIAYAIKENNFT